MSSLDIEHYLSQSSKHFDSVSKRDKYMANNLNRLQSEHPDEHIVHICGAYHTLTVERTNGKYGGISEHLDKPPVIYSLGDIVPLKLEVMKNE
jgi:uncharacterized iron-regulated protein